MKPIRTKLVRTAALLGALAAVGMPACGGRSAGPRVGGESHFLTRCVSSCLGGLECISGVCTKPCIVGDDSGCTGLFAGAICTADSGEPGAVAICDVACEGDSDCSVLGAHGCSVGYCRSPAQADVGTGGTDQGNAGTSGGSGPVSGATSGGSSSGDGGTGGSGAVGGGMGGSGTGGSGAVGGSTGGSGQGGSGVGDAGQAGAGTGGLTQGMGGTTGGTASVVCQNIIVTSPAENYQYSSTINIGLTKVKPRAELTFDWSDVTADFRHRPVDLDNVEMVEFSLWEQTPASFADDLNADLLNNPIVITSFEPLNGETSASVFQFGVPSGPLDSQTFYNYLDETIYPPENHVYALMVAQGTDYGMGTYMLGTLQLDPESTNTLVRLDSNSAVVDYTATIASRPPVYVPAGTADITIDWTKLKTTAAGGEFIPSSITRFRIASYDLPPAELEGENFLNLDEIAAELYEAEVLVGTRFSFDKAMTKGGKAFAGIDDTHTWLVALNCGACQNPAPWYLAVLKACPESP